MRTETTQRRKRVSKAARQKQKLMMIGGLAIVLILIIVLAIFVFVSCGTDYTETDTNTVYVIKDGKIVSTDIEAFDEKNYDKEKLGDYVQKVIDTYNSKNGEDSLIQKSYEVEENKAILVLEYANADVYEDVNGVELFIGSIKDAKKAGYDFKTNFVKMVDGKTVDATIDELEEDEEYQVVIIKSNTKVVVNGDVRFVSTQNVAEVGENYVLIKDGASLGETVLDTEELGTEMEGSDGAIGEDELVAGEEEEIIFDFGDEPDEEDSQYSEVLTYIIYK